MSDNIKVVVKVRPLISREIDQKLSYQWRVKNDTLHQLDQNGSGREFGSCFTFDKVYDKETKTHEVYNDIAKPIVEAAIAGFNGTIFAYGQTSSGKTYTMSGTEESPGIIPMAVLNLFEIIKSIPDRDFLVRVSYIEIYNETVKDLLNVEKKNIKVHDTLQGVKVDATERPTASPEEVLEAMKEGEANRQTGATNMNEESSRSHSIFQITIESRVHIEGEEEVGCVNVSQLNLVDLAGSERAGQTGATGIRFKEGTHINKSLSVLALVIKQLSEDPNKHANYRDSKLTRILQNSLGGNAKTSIICAITPASVEETISTLQFANRAKAIKNKPEVNAVATIATKIHSMTKQLSQLQSQLETKKNLEQDNVNLQKQIAALQKLILNGFGQTNRMDMLGSNRRKWQQPHRRITISTLHPIEEGPMPTVPKFCTPSLKYNPMSLSGATEFLPIQNTSKLASLPEESRLVTPPPFDKKVDLETEIIEIDSDDDDINSEAQSTCSPYHKCFVSSKTPPCVLRKNAKEAEKDLKDILELTEIEKMYTPTVVELMVKLEEKSDAISKLEETVHTLTNENKDKDSQLDLLKEKIKKTEEEFLTITSVKLNLEAMCKEYSTKLTDWEVSYETLKNQAKTREDELLSFLEEQRGGRRTEVIGKISSKPLERELFFLDMSKDMSLVNSDNESSTTNANDDELSTQVQDIVTSMQSQLTAKNKFITDLEADIFIQKQKITSLENSRQDLQAMIDGFKDKLALIDGENSFFKSTVDNLKSTIETQKVTIETANNNIKSYNSLIQELQIKLISKDDTLNLKIDDGVLDSLVANEEKFISNNENMKNIIQTFKLAINSRNKEINHLKSTVQDNTGLSTENMSLKQELKLKENQISTLIDEGEKLKDQLNENIGIINKLMSIEQESTKKLIDIQEQNNVLQMHNQENTVQIEKLKENNDKLTLVISEKELNILDILNKNEDLAKQIEVMTKKVMDLENDIQLKNNLITSLSNIDHSAQDHLMKAKSIFSKLHQVSLILNNKEDTIPETIDSLDVFFSNINNNLNNLEVTTRQIIEDRKMLDFNAIRMTEELSTLTGKHSELQMQIENHCRERNEIILQHEDLSRHIAMLTDELNTIREEINIKNQAIVHMETKLNNTEKNYENLRSDTLSKDNLIISLQDETTSLYSQQQRNIADKKEIEDLKKSMLAAQDSFNQILNDKEQGISELNNRLKAIEILLEEKLTKEKQNLTDKKENEDVNKNMLAAQERLNQVLKNKELEILEVNEKLKTIVTLLEEKITEIKTLQTAHERHESLTETLHKEIADKDVKLKETAFLLEGKQEEVTTLRNEISELNNRIEDIENRLEAKHREVTALTKELEDSIEDRNKLLENIFNKASKLLNFDLNVHNNTSFDLDNVNTFDQIILCLDKIANRVTILKSENESKEINEVLSQTKEQIAELTDKNVNLMNNFSTIDTTNLELLEELEKIKAINNHLSGTSELLEEMKTELSIKSKELETMELKARELKNQFVEFEFLMKQQMEDLLKENERLKENLLMSESGSKAQIDIPDYPYNSQTDITDKQKPNIPDKLEKISPKSLVTICCNRMIEQLQLNETESTSVTPSSSKSSFEISNPLTQVCECIELSLKLQAANENNRKLQVNLEHLESKNQHLIIEQEETRKEVKLLLESSRELQKKHASHRTNLSTLTATTYAENKLLNSQLKVLKHHHTRYIQVCQRDLPAFKSLLNELMTILRGNALSSDQVNASFKRYSLPDVLDSNTTVSNFKNESTLDGDLLMLDTNVTVTTADDTLLGHDQTCLEATQTNFDPEVPCQTTDISKVFDPCFMYSQVETFTNDNMKLYKKLERLKEENYNLTCRIEKYSASTINVPNTVDAQNSPIKIKTSNENHLQSITDLNTCYKYKSEEEQQVTQNELLVDIEKLSQELANVKAEKADIENKYSNLALEIPSTDTLIKKINILEREYNNKLQEITKVTNDFEKKTKMIKGLQEENDILSTQLMENISESEDLRKELDTMKDVNIKLTEKCEELNKLTKEPEIEAKINSSFSCPQCPKKDEVIKTLRSKHASEPHSKLNRSLSDSDSSSRYNKICTLQQELLESKEDCKKITEEVATIKNHFERSNLSMSQSMDLDESMGDANIFTFTKDFENVVPQLNKFDLGNLPEEDPTDFYTLDKIYCFNYFVEKTGADKENLNCDVKIFDVMKMLHDNLVTKHSNEVENLLNKLRDFEDSRNQLQSQISDVNGQYLKLTKELEDKDNLKTVTNILSHIKNNLNIMNAEMSNITDMDKNKLISMFKENVLQELDNQFGISIANTFESLMDIVVTKHQNDLSGIMDKYTVAQDKIRNVLSEFNTVSDHLKQMKLQLSNKETEYNLLEAQKVKINEICNAVTLDLIKKEENLSEAFRNGCEKLIELNIVSPGEIDLTLPVDKSVILLLDRVIKKFQKQYTSNNENIALEVKKTYTFIEEKEIELKVELLDKESELKALKSLYEDLNNIYMSTVEENKTNLDVIEKLTEELNVLKDTILKKETIMENLQSELKTQRKDILIHISAEVTELKEKLEDLIKDNIHLKSVNQMIIKEKEEYASELEKSGETIRLNKIELDRMTSDILVLRESVKDNVSVIESLTLEAKSLMEQNLKLKQHFDEKSHDLSRLEINIKTHEKTAQIQCKMILRLQKQKDENDKVLKEKDERLEELTQKCNALQTECEDMKGDIKASKEELVELKNIKDSLEVRVTELEKEVQSGNKHRLSIEGIADNSRRRRQSIYDLQRMFADEKQDFEDHNKMEALFDSRAQPDDLFMDEDDEENSNRSTPLRLSRGRESFISRPDQSDKEEEHSRPSSVMATRLRRQSIHDKHRSVLQNVPSPHDHPLLKLTDALIDLKTNETSENLGEDSEASELRERLANCQLELEELRERYRELDEECETCAQYLRERDDTCARLKRENTDLGNQVKELQEKLKSRQNRSHKDSKTSYCHASVNTDEDWANLHSVVVDRMSFDAEVEKNKKLTKTIEELRYKKQELRNMVDKMQKAMEKHGGNRDTRELEKTKSELKACKHELAELQERYRELDEECETCAEYLRERDEQCRKLKEAKTVLEAKLQEFQETASHIAHTVRKKRQSMHDQNRSRAADLADASTETSDDFLSYQVERDVSSQTMNDSLMRELAVVKMTLDKVCKEKAALEQLVSAQMAAVHPAMYVATGSAIVQNQQLTDVMKENHKLKKINAKLVHLCKKRGKGHESNRENEDPTVQG